MIQKKTIAVLGMMCAGCAASVDRKLNSLEGIVSASVNLPGRTVLVEYDDERITLEQMKQAVSAIGYDMVIEEDRNVEAIERRAYQTLRLKVIVSWLFAIFVMALCMGWFGMSALSNDYRNQLALIISLLNLA